MADCLPALRILNLSTNDIRDTGVENLSKLEFLESLDVGRACTIQQATTLGG